MVVVVVVVVVIVAAINITMIFTIIPRTMIGRVDDSPVIQTLIARVGASKQIVVAVVAEGVEIGGGPKLAEGGRNDAR
jgi:hypothetical protein